MRRLPSAAALAAALAAGCGPDAAFDRALSREQAGAFAAAAERFAAFAEKHPDDPRVPEALVRAARIYTYQFQRCPEALPLLERAVRERPDGPWAEPARLALLDCPEYFPIREGAAWEYVDSQTGGKNMRLEMSVRSSSRTVFEIVGDFYAGETKFQQLSRRYYKEGWAVWEIDGRDPVPILKYPYREGHAWSARRGGRKVEFRIESSKEKVQVLAGTYQGCLKVREAQPGMPAWKYDYYAPGVGRVKTTIGGRGFENPNTELRSAEIPRARVLQRS